MIQRNIFILTSFLLGFVASDLAPIFIPSYNFNCPEDFRQTCNLECSNGNYLLDDKGCPTCACESACPEIKCRANCGDAGYVIDENGCQTCVCAKKERVQCSKVMCRMFCEHGFKRDENGCEYCACNSSPQPCPALNCDNSCPSGYQKDYSGCPTCECVQESKQQESQCDEIVCDLACKYGYQRDERGCEQCVCNTCPLTSCRMFCKYGFRRNEDGCEVCECDWSPVAENIQCDERIPCEGARICNLELRLCEAVSPDRVNWFLYDFEVDDGLFEDQTFVQIFKKSLIQKIAAKYALSTSQITVSSVEQKGLTSFQIMPFFDENLEEFDQKMDKIDADLNSHEFREVLPSVVDVIDTDKTPSKLTRYQWCSKIRSFVRSRPMFFATVTVLSAIGLVFLMAYFRCNRRQWQLVNRSDSKLPIYEANYSLTQGDEDHDYPSKHIIIESDDLHSSNDKRTLV